jgi:hypothetical protein
MPPSIATPTDPADLDRTVVEGREPEAGAP